MAIICKKYNLLFIMTPRTACTAIGKILIDELNGEYLPSENKFDENGFRELTTKHTTVSDLLKYNILSKEDLSRLYKFTAVRNPYDSLASFYIKKKHKYANLLNDPDSWVYQIKGYKEDMEYCRDHTFNQWIFKNYSRSVIKRMLGYNTDMYHLFTDGVDRVLKFENINTDLNRMMKDLGINKTLEIPLINKTSERKKDYRDYYSGISRAIVGFAFADTLKKYRYSF